MEYRSRLLLGGFAAPVGLRSIRASKVTPARRPLVGVALLSVLAALSGCGYRTLLESIAPKTEVEFAKARFEDLRAGRLDALESHLDLGTATSNPTTRADLERARLLIPAGDPKSIELIGSQISEGPGGWTGSFTFQYEFPRAWMLARAFLHRSAGGAVVVKGMHVQPLPDSLQHLNAFTFTGKGPLHYAILAAALAFPLFTLAVLVVCLRTAGLRRRWLWALVTLLGVTGVTLNWTTGTIAFQTAAIHLLGAGFTTNPYSPVFLTVSFPLGAMLFLARRRRLRAAAPTRADSEAPEQG